MTYKIAVYRACDYRSGSCVFLYFNKQNAVKWHTISKLWKVDFCLTFAMFKALVGFCIFHFSCCGVFYFSISLCFFFFFRQRRS